MGDCQRGSSRSRVVDTDVGFQTCEFSQTDVKFPVVVGENEGSDPTEETLQEVLERANEPDLEREVNRRRLKRWRDEGLVRSPRKEGLGRGKGTAVYYSAGTGELVAAIAQELEETRKLSTVAVKLWIRGYPLTSYVRNYFLSEWEEIARRVRALDRAADMPKPEDPLRQWTAQDRLPRFGQLRKAVGVEGFDRVARLLVNLLVDEKEASQLRALLRFEEERDSTEKALRKSLEELLGIELDDEDDVTADEISELLAEVSQAYGPQTRLKQARRYDQSEWETLRDRAKDFVRDRMPETDDFEGFSLLVLNELLSWPEGSEKRLQQLEKLLDFHGAETAEEVEQILMSATGFNL